jgi:hypothetical protein
MADGVTVMSLSASIQHKTNAALGFSMPNHAKRKITV